VKQVRPPCVTDCEITGLLSLAAAGTAKIKKNTESKTAGKQEREDMGRAIGKRGKTIRIDSQNRLWSMVFFLGIGEHLEETVQSAVRQVPPVKLPPDTVFLVNALSEWRIKQQGLAAAGQGSLRSTGNLFGNSMGRPVKRGSNLDGGWSEGSPRLQTAASFSYCPGPCSPAPALARTEAPYRSRPFSLSRCCACS